MSGKKPFSSSNRRNDSRSGGGFRRGRNDRNRSGGGFSARRGGHGGGRGRSRGGSRKLPTFNPSQFINRNPVEVKEEVYTPKNTFETFGLDTRLVKAIHAQNITTPSPIQDQIIPEILNDNDVIGLAETGTGKTAAFLVPLIEKILRGKDQKTLVLVPTRELAIQIEQELRKFTPRGARIFSATCVGGVNIRPQINALRKHNDFIIGTPGRVLDLIDRTILDTSTITTVVLDEADRMLDMGFINDMRSILENTPKSRETLFFSATFDDKTKKLADDFLRDPVTISVKKKDVTNSIEQDVVPFDEAFKFGTLMQLLENPELKRVLIFGAMKHSVKKLAEDLNKHHVQAESIHGNKTHQQRQKSLKKFKSGNARVLVATDVAARGIHVDGVSHVINYDLPTTFEDYVHRIGRTGRGTERGKALTFVPAER